MLVWDDSTTFAKAWSRSANAHPEQTFLVFEGPDGSVAEWSYQEFDRVIARAATLLVAEGVANGSSVHMALTNSPTFVAVWLASVRLGAWVVPSDPMAREAELADHIARTAPAIGFCSHERVDTYRAAADEAMPVIVIDETDVEFEQFPDAEFSAWPTVEPADRAAVMFTSGTTGRPKGVEITQANYGFAGYIMARASALGSHDRQLVVLPLFHANAQYYSLASAIWVGASVAVMHTFSASGFLQQAKRHQVSCASLFAAPIRMILARGAKIEGLTLRHCWFAQNLADDQYEKISDWLGCRPRQLYGMTETIPAVLTDGVEGASADSMGFVTDGCEVDLHDAMGEPVADGHTGEIVVRGIQGERLFAGYLDDRATTAASFRGDWFVTGDRAHRRDGRFFFDGRHSDVLKVAGENVSTVEVETVLSAHPDVLEATIIAASDTIFDEVPVAFVVPVDAANPPDADDLTAWCSERLAKAKVPRQVTFLDELPRTSVGKIRKFILKESLS